MSVSPFSAQQFSMPEIPKFHTHVHLKTPVSRWKLKPTAIRCRNRSTGDRIGTENYYELLGVSADSNAHEIKEAYRKLQKKYHPDIAGQKGHEYTLMLNKAYDVLMKEELRKEYDASIGKTRLGFGRNTSRLGYSSWKGPLRPQALFVDENACIGCRECVHHASSTFTMDESLGSARVKVQYGDDDGKIEVSVDSCPVNCIYWVDREDLAALEFIVRPQPKEGYGVFGGGWERPANVFMAAKLYKKQLEQAADYSGRNAQGYSEETSAQAQARAMAAMELEMNKLSGIWSWVKKMCGSLR